MSGAPSSTPRGERVGTPGITWQTRLVSREQHVDDDTPDPRPNRATRRAMKRAARKQTPAPAATEATQATKEQQSGPA